METPQSIDDLAGLVREHRQVIPLGGHTKPALSAEPENVTPISMRGLSGILEYEPTEFTFTALAGTPVAEVRAALAKNGQYMPFDPVGPGNGGATLGAAIATGFNGPGSYRFGTIRDFVLAVEFLDGTGQRLRSGAKVVKNAAGFDLPKFLVGSLGRFGIITEASFKVFPCPPAQSTLAWKCPTVDEGVWLLQKLSLGSWDVDALELDVAPEIRVVVRLRGDEAAVTSRVQRLLDAVPFDGQALEQEAAVSFWEERRALITDQACDWVKIPLTPTLISELDETLNRLNAQRHYSLGGNVAWAGVPLAAALSEPLKKLKLTGLVIHRAEPDPAAPHILGSWRTHAVHEAVRKVLDPVDRFPRLRPPLAN